nr:MAG TPA: hypothetical protein [Caudoviricetes sp.]
MGRGGEPNGANAGGKPRAAAPFSILTGEEVRT